MKNLVFITTIMSLLFCSPIIAQQSISGSFASNGNTRTYIGAIPDNPQTPLRLVVLFCGAAEDAAEMQKRHFNDYLGDNTMVVYPEPYYFMGSFQTDSVANDFLMVEDLITHIAANYSIDVNDICIGGFSAGAAFSYDLVCEFNSSTSTRPYSFKAFAVVAGAMDTAEVNLNYCPIADEVPLIAFHGTNDQAINYNGTTIFTGGIDTIIVYNSPVETLVDFWARNINGCNANPTVTPLPDLVVEPQVPTTVELIEYNCNNCNNTKLYRIVGGLHTWPTSNAVNDNMFGGHNRDIIASELIADFFECSAPLSTSKSSFNSTEVSVYPNPFIDHISIETSEYLRKVEVFSLTGQRVFSMNEPNLSIALNDLTSGMYFLSVETDKGTTVKKIIKN